MAYSQFSTVFGDIGAGTIGGGLGISQRSTNANYINNATHISVLDASRKQIDRIPVDQMEYYVDHLTSGEYIAVYSNIKGQILWEIPFTVE